jgi:hypothetical protein
MSQLSLPDRPLSISKKARPAYWGQIFLGLFLIALGAGISYWQVPSLQHDWTISRNPVLVYDADVQNGKCTTRKAIFTDCSAHLSYVVDGTRYETESTAMFVDFHTGDYMVDVVRSGDDPSLATMSIGIDKLWNRVIVLLVLLGFTLGIGVVVLAKALGLKRDAGIMARPGRMTVHEVLVTGVTQGKRANAIAFQNPRGPNSKTKFISSFGKTEAPMTRGGPNGETFALSVLQAGAKLPVMLDAGLERLDLTAAERDAAMAGLGVQA